MSKYFIAYDLVSPGQNYAAVKSGVEQSCDWYIKFQYSLYFVVSRLTAREVYDIIRKKMDANDRLAVIEATDAVVDGVTPNVKAAWHNMWDHGTPFPKVA